MTDVMYQYTASEVGAGGTITFTYLTGTDAADYNPVNAEITWPGGNILSVENGDIVVTLGISTVAVVLATGRKVPAGVKVSLGLEPVDEQTYSFDITDYGAIPDGDENDASVNVAALRSVAAAMYARGGGDFVVPPGHYYVNAETQFYSDLPVLGKGLSHPALCVFESTHAGNIFRFESYGGMAVDDTDQDVFLEKMKFILDSASTGIAVQVIGNGLTLRDIRGCGGSSSSWMIDCDRLNVGLIHNVKFGGAGSEELRGNGIRYRNTDKNNFDFNFGDSLLQTVFIQLGADNTTAFKFEGPTYPTFASSTAYALHDHVAYSGTLYECILAYTSTATTPDADATHWVATGANKINFVGMQHVQATSGGSIRTGTIGIHIYNSARIHFTSTDIENIDVAVKEESQQSNGAIAENNDYMGLYVLNCNTAYSVTGTPAKTTFVGNDNFPGSGYIASFVDGDAILAAGVYLSATNFSPSIKFNNNSGTLRISDGADDGSITIDVSGDNPTIKQTETGGGAKLFLGNSAGRSAPVSPVLATDVRTAVPIGIDNGMIAYADGTSWNPMGDGYVGFVGRVAGAWVKLH